MRAFVGQSTRNRRTQIRGRPCDQGGRTRKQFQASALPRWFPTGPRFGPGRQARRAPSETSDCGLVRAAALATRHPRGFSAVRAPQGHGGIRQRPNQALRRFPQLSMRGIDAVGLERVGDDGQQSFETTRCAVIGSSDVPQARRRLIQFAKRMKAAPAPRKGSTASS